MTLEQIDNLKPNDIFYSYTLTVDGFLRTTFKVSIIEPEFILTDKNDKINKWILNHITVTLDPNERQQIITYLEFCEKDSYNYYILFKVYSEKYPELFLF